jgi:hypothetical protein
MALAGARCGLNHARHPWKPPATAWSRLGGADGGRRTPCPELDPEPALIADDRVARCETERNCAPLGAANVLRSVGQALRLNRISSAWSGSCPSEAQGASAPLRPNRHELA